jgi:hypothetical protein
MALGAHRRMDAWTMFHVKHDAVGSGDGKLGGAAGAN